MKKLLLICIAIFCLSADYVRVPFADDPTNTNAKIKAVFLYNFTKYIEWPKNYKEGNFVIGVMGSTTFYTNLSSVLSTKTVGLQKFEVKNFPAPESITGTCHILFIPAENSAMLADIIKKMKGKNTLIVTEKQGLAKQGSAINFIVENNKQKFELSKASIEKSGLNVSANLLALGVTVE